MTPIFLILGQSNAGLMERSGAVQSALEAMGSDAVVVGVHGGGFSSARADGEWNIIEGDGTSAGGEAYDDLLATMEQVRLEIPDAYIAGAIWAQGESDRSASLDYYGAVKTLFTQMHEDLGEEFPITILGLSDFQGDSSGAQHVQDSQALLAEDLSFVSLVDPDQLISDNDLSEAEVMRDDLHYNPEFFDYVADAVLAQPGILESLGLGTPVVDTPIEEPIAEEPTEDPVAEPQEPTETDPIDDPAEEEPVAEPVVDEPVDKPVVDEPAVDEPVVDEPANDPADDAPLEKPIVIDLVDDEPEEPADDAPTIEDIEEDDRTVEPIEIPVFVPEEELTEEEPVAIEEDSNETAGAAMLSLGSLGLLMGSGIGLAVGAIGALFALVGGGKGNNEASTEETTVEASLPQIVLGRDVQLQDILPSKDMAEDTNPLGDQSEAEEDLVLDL